MALWVWECEMLVCFSASCQLASGLPTSAWSMETMLEESKWNNLSCLLSACVVVQSIRH